MTLNCEYRHECSDYRHESMRCFWLNHFCERHKGFVQHYELEIKKRAEHLKRLSGYDKKDKLEKVLG